LTTTPGPSYTGGVLTLAEVFLRDLRYALRGLRRAPSFSAIVILTLALGIGANTAIFSVVRAVLLKPLPYPEAERLVRLGESTGEATGISVTWINYLHWRNENHTFDALAGFEQGHFTLTGRGEPLFTRAVMVSRGFFPLLGRKPLLGRHFIDSDDRSGAPSTVVLNYKFWMEKLGGDPAILGATLALDDKPYEVIGVSSPAWEFLRADYYLPLTPFKDDARKRSQHGSMRVLGRLKPGVTLAAARADLDSIMAHLAQTDPGPENDHHSYVAFLADLVTGEVRSGLLILMGAVGLVLLIACANVASLILARSTTRTSEIAIRTAIGAGRTRLVRQLLTETLLLAALGGASGLLLARWCLAALLSMGPKEIPRLAETTLDFPVFLFAGAISVLAGLMVGLVPVFAAGKFDLVSALKDSSRGATGARSGQSLRNVLIVSEIAITLVLAFASGLLLRSLNAAVSSYPGFRSEGLLSLELVLPSSGYKSAEAQQNFYDRLIADLRGVPGVMEVAAVHCPPSAGDCGDWFYSVLDRPAPARSEVPVALVNIAYPSYFHTMSIALRQGRAFTEADRAKTQPVAIVNETFARRWWPTESAVGRRIKSGGPYFDGPVYEIVGVAGDVSQMGLDSEPLPEIYIPFSQAPSPAMVVMIRTTGNPELLVPGIRQRIMSVDLNLPIESVGAFEKTLGATLQRRRFSTLLLTSFAALAMILAGVGIFGLLNYWVSVREEEIAIRAALGASPAAILRWGAGHTLKLAVLGIALGAVVAFLTSRWMESLVFGVSAQDPLMLAAAAFAVLAIIILAALLPVWRATQIDTVRKLHHG
jgi:putative ABC transport system permease protein